MHINFVHIERDIHTQNLTHESVSSTQIKSHVNFQVLNMPTTFELSTLGWDSQGDNFRLHRRRNLIRIMGGRIRVFLFRKSKAIIVSHPKAHRHKCLSHRCHSSLGNPFDELSRVTLKFCLYPWKARNLDLLFFVLWASALSCARRGEHGTLSVVVRIKWKPVSSTKCPTHALTRGRLLMQDRMDISLQVHVTLHKDSHLRHVRRMPCTKD